MEAVGKKSFFVEPIADMSLEEQIEEAESSGAERFVVSRRFAKWAREEFRAKWGDRMTVSGEWADG